MNSNSDKSLFLKSLLTLATFYLSVGIALYFLEYFLSNIKIFSESNFLNWDAMHYNTIREHGYHTGMVAFFPLFSFIWQWLHLSAITVSIFNGGIYIVSFAWLASVFQIQKRNLIFLASIPSMIFMFLPYSEAIFFLTSTIFLVGLKKNNFHLLILGIALSGITRPVATIFIPAIFTMHYFTMKNTQKTFFHSFWMVFACAGSTMLVFALQYYQTGEWFSFSHVQKEWGNYLRLPVFPLTSWAGGFIVRLDATAFFFGIAAAVWLGILLMKKINFKNSIDFDKALVFSLCFLFFLSIILLFTRGGVLNSLNRYIFCSAFIIVAIHNLMQKPIFNKQNALLLIFFSSLFWLLFASYVHIQTVVKFEFLSLYLLLILVSTAENQNLKKIGYFLVLTGNTIFFFIFFHRFLSGEWVG